MCKQNIYKFKGLDNISACQFCLRNVSVDFTINKDKEVALNVAAYLAILQIYANIQWKNNIK